MESIDKAYLSLSTAGSCHQSPTVVIDVVPTEDINLPDLIQTDHEELRKVMLTLSYLVEEMDNLIRELSSFYYPLLYYGEGIDDKLIQQGEAHVCAGRMVYPLQQLLNLINHSYRVIKNVIAQLSKLYCTSDSGPKYFDVGESHFKIIFERLSSLLVK